MIVPQLVKLVHIIPHIKRGTHVYVRCRFNAMDDYTEYKGSDIVHLPTEVLESLCVEGIETKLTIFQDGIIPALVITASDDVTVVTFNPNGFFQEFGDTPSDDDLEPSSS